MPGYEKDLVEVNWRKGKADSTGHYPAPEWQSDKSVFDVDHVFAMEFIDGKPFFAVKWTGYSQKENTLEPMENVSMCRLIDIFSDRLFNKNLGSVTSNKAIRSAVSREGLLTSEEPLFDKLQRVTTGADIGGGTNGLMEKAFVILRRFADENKFCHLMGFYSYVLYYYYYYYYIIILLLLYYCFTRPKADIFGVYKNEIDFIREVSAKLNEYSHSYKLMDCFIGNCFARERTDKRLLEFEALDNRRYSRFYLRNLRNIQDKFADHLRSNTGILCLVVGAKGKRFSEDAADEHSKVLVIDGKGEHRRSEY